MPWGKQDPPGARMNHVYPQLSLATEESLDYVWRLSTQFPFFVKTVNDVLVTSGLTTGRP